MWVILSSFPDTLYIFFQSENDEGEKAIKYAVDAGYRHFDTAFFYQNEAEVGKALREKIAEGVVRREDVFVVTKVSLFYRFCYHWVTITF